MQNVNVTVCVIYLIWLFILLMCVVSGGSFYQAINFVCTIRIFNKLHFGMLGSHINVFGLVFFIQQVLKDHIMTANGTKKSSVQ